MREHERRKLGEVPVTDQIGTHDPQSLSVDMQVAYLQVSLL